MGRKRILIMLFVIAASELTGQTTFSEVSIQSGIDYVTPTRRLDGAGAAFFDYNNDGWIDIYLTGGDNRRDALFRNNQDGTFTDVAFDAGFGATHSIPTYGVATADIDNDGDRDVLITTERTFPSLLMLNNGDGTFTNISNQAGIDDRDMDSHAVAFGDYNLDGYLDFYLIGWINDYIETKGPDGKANGYSHNCFKNKFYKNNGDNSFTELSGLFGMDDAGCGLATVFSDFDNDHDQDVLLANDFGRWVSPNVLFENDYPNDGFINSSVRTGMSQEMYGMGIAVGDYDHDRDLDYYFTSIDHNFLMQNQGDGTFVDVASQLGVQNDSLYDGSNAVVTSWGTAFMDVDNDSFEDLFVANGKVPSYFRTALLDPNKLFLNDRNGGFADISVVAGIDRTDRNRSLIYADYDNDGDLDALITTIDNNVPTESHVLLFRNELDNDHNWLQVQFEGVSVNRDAYGVKAIIHIGEESWVQEVNGGASFRSQHSSIMHFGLGMASKVDSLEVFWPGGAKEVMKNVPINERIKVKQGDFVTSINAESAGSEHVQVWPNPSGGRLNIKVMGDYLPEVAFSVFDLRGNEIPTESIYEEQHNGERLYTMDLSEVPDGLYLLKVVSGKGTFMRRVQVKGGKQ